MNQIARPRRLPLENGQVAQVLRDEIAALTQWLETNASFCETERAHMEIGSHERAYWHYGYLVALRDTLTLLENRGD